MTLVEFLMKNWLVIAFYLVVILLLVIYRKKFEFQGKIIALRRTKIGIKWMERMGKRHGEKIKILGYIGIGVGFTGMVFIFVYVIKAFLDLFLKPDAPAAFSLVLPGVNIPGSPIAIPLWVIFALFVVVAIHEAGHGLVARAHKLKIDNTGIVFFGPLIGAFVEPNEKQLKKQSDVVQYSIFAAGPFANALTAIVAFLLLTFIFIPLVPLPLSASAGSLSSPTGFYVAELTEGFPAADSGMAPLAVYSHVNDVWINSSQTLLDTLRVVKPGDTVNISNATHAISIVSVEHPEDSSRGYLGVMGIVIKYKIRDGVSPVLYYFLKGLAAFVFWIFVLSLGLGAFNLLPLGPVDGGQMFRLASWRVFGEKKGTKYWSKLGLFLLILVIILVFLPMIRSVIG